MGKKALNLENKKFGRLTVVEKVESKRKGNKVMSMWKCKCDCGKTVVVAGYRLNEGVTKSCGCLQKEKVSKIRKKHGMYNTKLYKVWNSMIQRCENANCSEYKYYGLEGKTVCKEWHDFESFYKWSLQSGYKDGLEIERINNNYGYSPVNCKWTTRKEQMNNTRQNHLITYNGKTQTMAQWAEELNISYRTLCSRIDTLKWDVEKAFNTPVRTKKKE